MGWTAGSVNSAGIRREKNAICLRRCWFTDSNQVAGTDLWISCGGGLQVAKGSRQVVRGDFFHEQEGSWCENFSGGKSRRRAPEKISRGTAKISLSFPGGSPAAFPEPGSRSEGKSHRSAARGFQVPSLLPLLLLPPLLLAQGMRFQKKIHIVELPPCPAQHAPCGALSTQAHFLLCPEHPGTPPAVPSAPRRTACCALSTPGFPLLCPEHPGTVPAVPPEP